MRVDEDVKLMKSIFYFTSLLLREAPNSPNVFQYNSYGVTLTEVTLDVLTGKHIIDRVDMLFDCGERYRY